MLIVAATRGAADELARLVAVRRGATFGLRRYSLGQLAALLAITNATTPMGALGGAAVAARVSHQALQDGALRYYAPVVPFPGFPRALAGAITELRLADVEPDALKTAALGDISQLLRRFNGQLEESRLHDWPALLRTAAAAAGADALLGHPLVLLDVAIDSSAHKAFVASLLNRARTALVTVAAGDEPTRQALSDLGVRPPREETQNGGIGGRPPSDDPPARGHDELGRVRTYLFAPEPPPADVRRGDVVLFSAPGEGRECIEIARRALEEAGNGVAFDQMAVLLRDPARYTRLLETALARAGVPAYFARGTLRPDPAGRAFLTLLDCALERFSAKRFAEYLAFGQVPVGGSVPAGGEAPWMPPEDETMGAAVQFGTEPASATGASIVDHTGTEASPSAAEEEGERGRGDGGLHAPWKWEHLLVESAVVGGADRWRRRLDGLAAEMRLKIRALARDPDDASRAAAVERDLRRLNELRTFALPVIDALAALPNRATWAEWLPALETLAPRVLRRPERVLAVLAELRPLGPVGPADLGEVRAVLAPHLANLEQRPPADRYGRLFVGTIEEARGRAFEVVFAPGLAERGFPQKLREDPILLDEVREALALPLVTQRDRSDHERLLLRLTAGAAMRRLYLSYPRLDVDKGRPRVASFYALEVQRALTGDIPDPETLARTAADTGRTRLAWPAPDIPSVAIDEIEHDLATLRILLDESDDRRRGRARYLLALNDCLARSLRARWRRWRPEWRPADGLVEPTDAIRPALEAARLTARAYSVGALQHFAECPYRFLLLAIHRLEPREEPAPLEHLDPMTRGALFHDVQAQLMRRLRADGLLPLSPDRAAAARQALDATLAEVAARYREQLAPAIPRVWESSVEALRVDLRMWLERMIDAHATWDPIAFELAFGLPVDEIAGLDQGSVPHEVVIDGGYRIRGVADLIERHRHEAVLRVTDHKTGKVRTPKGVVVGGGRVLQPVLYALAVQDVLGTPVVEARLFYCTRDGAFEERVVRIAGTGAAARAQEVLATIDNAVATGFLAPAPRPGACRWCDVREVCGHHEERRIARKAQSRLADLNRMRGLR